MRYRHGGANRALARFTFAFDGVGHVGIPGPLAVLFPGTDGRVRAAQPATACLPAVGRDLRATRPPQAGQPAPLGGRHNRRAPGCAPPPPSPAACGPCSPRSTWAAMCFTAARGWMLAPNAEGS